MTPARTAASGLAAGLLALTAACTSGGTADDGGDDAPSASAGSEGAAPAPGVVPDATPGARAAAGWLAGAPDDGVVRTDGFDDYGLSIDVGLALDEVGGHEDTVAAITDAVRTDAAVYTTFRGDVYAGATAKALVFLQGQGADTGDLLAQLEGLVVADGPSEGRLADDADDDFSTVIGQAFGTRALVDAGSDEADRVASFLLDQQCADGFFRASFASPNAADETCDGAPDATPDADTTALALLVVGPVAAEVDGGEAAMAAAADWLLAAQRPDGGFVGSEGPGVNANTTGAAGWALGRWGETDAAAAAAAVVADLQVAEGPDAGAVAYDAAALDALGRRVGPDAADQFRRATAQAAPALLWSGG